MPRSRLLALAAIVALLVGGGIVWGGEEPPGPRAPTPQRPLLAEPEEPPVLVDASILSLRAQESEIIEQALVSTTSTSTSSSTTTTTVGTTTTTAEEPTTAAPPSTTPPSTAPPTTSAHTTAPPSTEAAGGFVSGAESEFGSLINSYRSSQGQSSLSRSGSLDSYARSWAKTLAGRGSLAHSDIGSLLGKWGSVGENVGVGSSVDGIFNALVGSPGHRDNMVGDFTHMGIGVYQDASGALWTAHVFAR